MFAVAEKPKTDEKSRKGEGRKTAPVQIDKELARMAAVIASHDGITQAELISPTLRPFLKMHYERVQKAIQDRLRKMNSENR